MPAGEVRPARARQRERCRRAAAARPQRDDHVSLSAEQGGGLPAGEEEQCGRVGGEPCLYVYISTDGL